MPCFASSFPFLLSLPFPSRPLGRLKPPHFPFPPLSFQSLPLFPIPPSLPSSRPPRPFLSWPQKWLPSPHLMGALYNIKV